MGRGGIDDTDPEARRVQIGILRRKSAAEKLAMVGSACASTRALVARFQDTCDADEGMIRRALATGRAFNLIHDATAFKLDLYPRKDGKYDQAEFERRIRLPLSPDSPHPIWVSSPEDVVLRKLAWYRSGGEVSDRQWNDVLGVLRVRGGQLDRAYLARWAQHPGVGELLAEALAEAGET